MHRPVMLVVLVGVLAAAAPAGAATLLVSPAGQSSGDCLTTPCSLDYALSSVAAMGDVIVVAPGTYGPYLDELTVPTGTTLRGQRASAKPLIAFAGVPAGANGLTTAGSETTIVRDVRIANTSTGSGTISWALRLGVNGVAERVEASSTVAVDEMGLGAACRGAGTAVWRNSVCWATQAPAMRIEADGGITGAIDHVTAIATGYPALTEHPVVSMTASIDASGSILRRTDGNGVELSSVSLATASRLNVSGTAPAGCSNCTTDAPAFVDAAAHDYRQTAASASTIDLGDEEATDDFDVEGEQRVIGAKSDIGADELPAAAGATVTGVSNVSDTGADVAGSFQTGSGYTSVHFEYGPGFSQSTPTVPAGLTDGTANATLAGLTACTATSVRLVAVNQRGRVESPAVDFTTAGCPTTTTTTTTPPPPPKVIVPASFNPNAVVPTTTVALRLRKTTVDLDGDEIKVGITSRSTHPISGRVLLTGLTGSEKLALNPSATKNVTFELSKAGARAIRRARKAKRKTYGATLLATLLAGNGVREQVTLALTIRL